jgi:transcriptional regulator
MYIPHSFRVEDQALLFDLMRQFDFATLVTIQERIPVASHLPFMVRPDTGPQGKLLGHMARANPQWRSFAPDHEVLTIFQAHHAYISPSWYEDHPSVPTWNYAVVHAYGLPHILEDEAVIKQMLHELVDQHESGFETPWRMDLPPAYERKMIQGIVAFEITLTRLEGKFKLSQNRSLEDQQAVAAVLERSEGTCRALGQLMSSLISAPSSIP